MPKKQKSYQAIVPLDSNSLKRIIEPGEIVELSEEDAKQLLDVGAIAEVKDGTDTKLN